MSRSKWTAERIEQLAAMTARGQPAWAIANDMGVSEKSVWRARHRHGIRSPAGIARATPPPISEEPQPEGREPGFIARLVRDGGHAVCREAQLGGGRSGVALWRGGEAVVVLSYDVFLRGAA